MAAVQTSTNSTDDAFLKLYLIFSSIKMCGAGRHRSLLLLTLYDYSRDECTSATAVQWNSPCAVLDAHTQNISGLATGLTLLIMALPHSNVQKLRVAFGMEPCSLGRDRFSRIQQAFVESLGRANCLRWASSVQIVGSTNTPFCLLTRVDRLGVAGKGNQIIEIQQLRGYLFWACQKPCSMLYSCLLWLL